MLSHVCGAILAFALVATPSYAATPGQDEYQPSIPGAGRDHHPRPGSPQADPEALPPSVLEALREHPDGEMLALLATSRELGAPAAGDAKQGNGSGDGAGAGGSGQAGDATGSLADDSSGRSLTAVLADSAGDGSALPLLVALAAIAAGAALLTLRRRRVGAS